MEQMLKSFNSSISAAEAKQAMTKNKDLVFLARTSLNKMLGILHRFDSSIGVVLDPDKSFANILGLNRNNTILVSPDADSLFRDPHAVAFEVAKREDIMNCSTVKR